MEVVKNQAEADTTTIINKKNARNMREDRV